MSNQVFLTGQHLTDIADAIRAKLHTADTYTPGEMAAAIGNIAQWQAPMARAKTTRWRPETGKGNFDVEDISWTVSAGTSEETLVGRINSVFTISGLSWTTKADVKEG